MDVKGNEEMGSYAMKSCEIIVYQKKNYSCYVGKFKDGKLNGIGYHYKSSGDFKDVYIGEYKDGKECGKGVRFMSNCKIFGEYIEEHRFILNII